MGPNRGGQADMLRVLPGHCHCLKLPRDAEERQNGDVMLADVFAAGRHVTEPAGLRPGESIVSVPPPRAGGAAGHRAWHVSPQVTSPWRRPLVTRSQHVFRLRDR
jgi:glutathione-independent formaldehyde dehydrogenase